MYLATFHHCIIYTLYSGEGAYMTPDTYLICVRSQDVSGQVDNQVAGRGNVNSTCQSWFCIYWTASAHGDVENTPRSCHNCEWLRAVACMNTHDEWKGIGIGRVVTVTQSPVDPVFLVRINVPVGAERRLCSLLFYVTPSWRSQKTDDVVLYHAARKPKVLSEGLAHMQQVAHPR